MELGVILLSAGFALVIFLLIAGRNSRKNNVWVHQKRQLRVRAVGPCAVAVGVYKTYEDRKQLEKTYSDHKSKS